MTDNQNCGIGTAILTFTLGAVIGGGVALLAAPRSGQETRKKMQDMVDDTRKKLGDLTQDAEDRVKKAVRESMDMLEEKTELVKMAAKAGKEAIDAEKEKLAKKA
ncbi:MAG: YtxH domain-containing protein [Desulfuromonadaceae bacterium]|nr:YtxH domain-containing protein [Desulfuromonadaceae bacterium]